MTELPAELANWPAWTPGDEQLGQLELLTSGAFAPLGGYLAAEDLSAVAARGELADGTPWPLPVTLAVPAAVLPSTADRLVLQDPEGSPLAVIEITERTAVDGPGDALRVAGPVTALRPPEHGPFRALRRRPADVRAELGSAPVLALATRRPLGQRQLGQLRHLADQLRARILLLPLVAGRPSSSSGRRRWSAPSARPPASSPTAPSWSRCRCRPRTTPPTSCGPARLSPPPTGRPTC